MKEQIEAFYISFIIREVETEREKERGDPKREETRGGLWIPMLSGETSH